jgi:NADPH:quinone reductase-like Zn-dependent oxidoreductase
MRAIGFEEFGGPEVFKELTLEEPHAGAGQVRVRVRAAAVSPSDSVSRSGALLAIMRQIQPDFEFPPPPWTVGWDVAGTVDEIGPDSDTDLSVGDRVIAITSPTTLRGTYVEYLVVPTESVVAAPENVDDAAASTVPMNGLTARMALDAMALPAGATIAVTGAAGIFGGFTVQLAKADGLRVVADASEADEALVKDLGADVIVRRGDDVARNIREVVPDGVDGLVDGSVQDEALAPAVRDNATIVTVRNFVGSTDRGISWKPVFVNQYLKERAKLARLVRQVESGELTPRVADTYPVSQAAEAHRRMEAGGLRGRLVLTF